MEAGTFPEPKIVNGEERILIGCKAELSFAAFNVGDLWRTLMPRRPEIRNAVSHDLISAAIYPSGFFQHFNPTAQFTKWIAVEVSDFNTVPEGLATLVIPGGLYAVFDYKGLSTDNSIFQYILSAWLPQSAYRLADRPHFEVLGEKYKNNDPDSEEEIWIPIELK